MLDREITSCIENERRISQPSTICGMGFTFGRANVSLDTTFRSALYVTSVTKQVLKGMV